MKRVWVTWNRSKNPKAKYYRLYRSEKMNIEKDMLNELLVARVNQPPVVNPVSIIDEPLIRKSNSEWHLEHKGILIDFEDTKFEFKLTILGVPVTQEFTLDVIDGKIIFIDEILGDVEILATYTFDGVSMWDYGVEEERKEYYGPEAKDTSKPTTPTNILLTPEYELNRLRLSWDDATPEGKTFYYRVQAFEDEHTYSKLSDYRSGKVIEELADRPYIIEKSNDGVVWKQTAKVQYKEFFDFLLDRTAPEPVRNLKAAMSLRTEDSNIDVVLNWSRVSQIIMTTTPMYRLRTVNRIGYMSEPSLPVGPIPFDTPVKEIVVRRKIADGTLPSFDGTDAETVAVLDKDAIECIDVVEHSTTYTYAVWVIDYGNNRSIAVSVDVSTPDNSTPTVPINLLVSEFSPIVN